MPYTRVQDAIIASARMPVRLCPAITVSMQAKQAESESKPESKQQHGSFLAIFESFFLLGWTAFGGPAHIALLHKQFVQRRK